MTAKDFRLIAETVAATFGDTPAGALSRATMARAFADRLARENPSFDRARFLKACGVDA